MLLDEIKVGQSGSNKTCVRRGQKIESNEITKFFVSIHRMQKKSIQLN